MSLRSIVFLCLASFAPACLCDSQHTFAIYLAAQSVGPQATIQVNGKRIETRLSERPIISDEDIVEYDFVIHSMLLREEALKRVPRPPVNGRPFVVVADGHAVYMGLFTTCLSSYAFPVPSIMVDRRMVDTNQPADTLTIEGAYGAYPDACSGFGADPRSDARIKEALTALKKLRDDGQHDENPRR